MINIVIAICAILYGYYTGDLLPAILGGILAAIAWNDFLLTVILSTVIIGLCSYYIWTDLIFHNTGNPKETLKLLSVAFIYMNSVFIKAAQSFR